MPTETEQAIAELHAWYCQRTGLVTKLCFSQALWFEMLRSYKYDAAALRADAELIVRYLKNEIAKKDRQPGAPGRNLGALKLQNFLQPDNFDSDLAIAKLARTKSTKVTRYVQPADPEVANDDPRRLDSVAKLRELRKSLRGAS